MEGELGFIFYKHIVVIKLNGDTSFAAYRSLKILLKLLLTNPTTNAQMQRHEHAHGVGVKGGRKTVWGRCEGD